MVKPRHLESFTHSFTKWAGTSVGFVSASTLTLTWLLSGIYFNYSNAWQTSLNTFTSIITFLMIFLMQRSQNKESLAIQVKLNELISQQKTADNNLINIEEASEEEIKAVHESHKEIAENQANK